jgi:excisionase family DNA binding protein
MAKPKADISINQLAEMLRLTRRAIDRAIEKGHLVYHRPAESGGRVRFARAYADQLKSRADEARAKGHKHVLRIAVASGPIAQRAEPPKKDMSAEEWMARLLRKLELRRPKANT